MYTAQKTRKENIAEYILYLWQLEDLLRALQFSPEAIYAKLVKPLGLPEEQKQEVFLWYMDIVNLLREEGCAAHCIVLTAHSDFEYARGALLFGADDYLLKPFRDQELTHAVARVCRKMESAPAANTPAVKKEPEATGYVRQAMDYIAGHYADENISIATIAEHLCVSEGHLSHVFKKQTGMTVTNYLTKTRIDAAMALLQTGRVKVYEAAAAVGYKDVTYFSATFKKLTGLSPSEVE